MWRQLPWSGLWESGLPVPAGPSPPQPSWGQFEHTHPVLPNAHPTAHSSTSHRQHPALRCAEPADSLRSNRTATGTSHPGAESTTAAQHSRPTPTTATHVRTRCLGRRAGAVSNFYFLVATLPFYLHLFSKHSVSCFWNQKTNIILKFRCKRLLVWERSPSRRLLKQKSRYASVMQSEKQKTNQDIM